MLPVAHQIRLPAHNMSRTRISRLAFISGIVLLSILGVFVLLFVCFVAFIGWSGRGQDVTDDPRYASFSGKCFVLKTDAQLATDGVRDEWILNPLAPVFEGVENSVPTYQNTLQTVPVGTSFTVKNVVGRQDLNMGWQLTVYIESPDIDSMGNDVIVETAFERGDVREDIVEPCPRPE